MTCADDSLSVGCICICDLMSPMNVKCSSNTNILVSSTTTITFVGADATKWWIMIVSASFWVFHEFPQWDICPLKICSEAGSFSVTINLRWIINIAFATRIMKMKWISCSLFSDTFSITSLDCIDVSSVKVIYRACLCVTVKSSQTFDTIIIVLIKYTVNICNL